MTADEERWDRVWTVTDYYQGVLRRGAFRPPDARCGDGVEAPVRWLPISP